MANQYREVGMPQIVVPDTEEEVEDVVEVEVVEVEVVTTTGKEITDPKVLAKRKVTTKTIKKNQRLTKDPEDHTDAGGAAVVVVGIVDAEVITDANAVKVQAMKTLRTKDVVWKTKAENMKDAEMKEVIGAVQEDTAVDQGGHHHRAPVTRVNTAIGENKKSVVNEKNVANETTKEGMENAAEDVDALKGPTALASREMKALKVHPRVVHLKASRICQATKPHHSNPHKYKARLRV